MERIFGLITWTLKYQVDMKGYLMQIENCVRQEGKEKGLVVGEKNNNSNNSSNKTVPKWLGSSFGKVSFKLSDPFISRPSKLFPLYI